MLRTPMAAFSGRTVSIALLFLLSFGLAAKAGEMTSSLLIGNARIDIMIERTSLPVPVKDIFRWVKSAAASVTTYYGRFPVPRVLIRIAPFEGRGVRDGMTFGDRGGGNTIQVSGETSPSELAPDLVLAHAMCHHAFPSLGEKDHLVPARECAHVPPIQ